MESSFAKKLVVIIFCIAALGAALFGFLAWQKTKKVVMLKHAPVPQTAAPVKKPAETKPQGPAHKVLGLSVESRPIEAYTFGNGPTQLVFIGGIHGGYEWNSVVLAYDSIDYLNQHPEFVPKNLAVTVVPDANPDGVYKIIGKEGRFTAADVPAGSHAAGRLNADKVDLNRNFNCDWKPAGIWQNAPVSAGNAAFSEPESAAIKKFVLENKPAAVVFWHSQAGAVYSANCDSAATTETLAITKAYASAAGYQALTTFDQYEVSGDATDWLASIGIPALTVELKTHNEIEWPQNLAGIKALIEYYAAKK
jgi:predicted deacylase